jgi:hypothetical protein
MTRDHEVKRGRERVVLITESCEGWQEMEGGTGYGKSPGEVWMDQPLLVLRNESEYKRQAASVA